MRTDSRFVFLLAVLALAAGVYPAGQSMAPAPGTQQSTQVATGFIAGVVVDIDGQPISAAQVNILPRAFATAGGRAMVPPAIIADDRGRFFFRNVAAGVYSLQAGKLGYGPARAGVQVTVEIGNGERAVDVRIRLAKYSTIAGTVRDAAGDPVVGVGMVAYRRALLNGKPTLQAASAGVKTDDRGFYRLSGFPAGEYVVCACMRDPNPFDAQLLTTLASEPINLLSVAARALTVGADVVSLDDTLRMTPPTFHPNSQSASRAERVKVAPGEDRTGVDINVELVRATRVSGRVVGAQSPVQAASIRLIPTADAESGVLVTEIRAMLVQPDGRFDFASVPPGQYKLAVTHPEGATSGGPSGLALAFVGARGTPPPSAPIPVAGPGVVPPPVLWADQTIVVGESGVRDLIVTLNPSPTVTGRLQFVGSAPQPTEQLLMRSRFGLEPIIPARVLIFGSIAADGAVRAVGAVPGKYVVAFSGVPGYQTLKSVTVGGADVTDMPIEVGEKDLAEVVLTYTDTPMGSVAVTVPSSPGQRPDDESVLVFPVDRRFWPESSAARRRFRTAPISTKGTATVDELPAGDYFVVLVTGQDAVDWQEPANLDTLSRRTQRVTITDGAKQTIEVRR